MIDLTDESALIAAYKGGDRRAGERLLAMHATVIRLTARRYFGRGTDNADVMQEARIGFLHGVREYDASRGASLCTYASYKVMGACRACVRVERFREVSFDEPLHDDGPDLAESVPDQSDGPDVLVAEADAQARRVVVLREAVSTLKLREAQALQRYDIDGLDLREVADEWGCTHQNVSQVRQAALAKVRRHLGGTARDLVERGVTRGVQAGGYFDRTEENAHFIACLRRYGEATVRQVAQALEWEWDLAAHVHSSLVASGFVRKVRQINNPRRRPGALALTKVWTWEVVEGR